MDSAGKRGKSNGTGARAATAGPCCSCQRDSLAACKHVATRRSWRTWNEQGAKQNEQGQTMRWAVGMAWHGKGEQAHSLQNRPLQADTAGGLSARHRPQRNKTATDAGRPRSETTAADKVGRPLAVQCRLMGGVQWCWHSGRRAQTYLPVPTPPIAFACHCTYPLP